MGTNKSPAGKHPWNSPGAAPIFGNGCGANGGNPNGCIGEDDVLGRCCGGSADKKTGIWNPGCGGYVGGESALSHYKDGIFGTPRVTTWERELTKKFYGNLKPITEADMPIDCVRSK